jgi:hypothetical protein
MRTDQIGTGVRIVDALADMIRAVHQICRQAAADESLAYLREAPQDIQHLYSTAQKLPKETYEIAHKMVHGEWPSYLKLENTNQAKKERFKTDVKDAVCA